MTATIWVIKRKENIIEGPTEGNGVFIGLFLSIPPLIVVLVLASAISTLSNSEDRTDQSLSISRKTIIFQFITNVLFAVADGCIVQFEFNVIAYYFYVVLNWVGLVMLTYTLL